MDNKLHEVFELFQKISSIPRCSKNEEKISAWILQWAGEKGFSFKKDTVGNLLISVPASNGFETADRIILQGHMDMVCEKTGASSHDFSKDPIVLIFDDEWVRAKDTTLGADNGIGLALAMAVAADKSLAHPPMELLFTVDEETGLTGASNLQASWLEGKILLNIDSEDEDVFIIGCAGGNDTRIELPLTFEPLPEKLQPVQMIISGLRGGHSGLDIDQQRANAIKIMARCLLLLLNDFPVSIIALHGGSAHNAIPRESRADIACDPGTLHLITQSIKNFEKLVREEFKEIEPDLNIVLEKGEKVPTMSSNRICKKEALAFLNLLCSIPHGVYRMSSEIPGLVETSSNLATVHTKNPVLEIVTSQRSNISSRLVEITENVKAVSFLAGAKTATHNDYPPWQPNMDSPLIVRCKNIYKKLNGNEPKIEVIHAGLECAVIGAKYPDMDMISLGPTIKGAHSPEEKLRIASVAKIRSFLETFLLKTDLGV